MGSDVESTSNRANMEISPYDKTTSGMKIGVGEMQGWRQTMEDAAIVLPNFQKNSSLFGILDGHGGSIISEFISVNFKKVLIQTKSYINGNYEQALVHTFLIMDELLKDKEVNDFIYNTHNLKEEKQKEKDNVSLLRSRTMVKSNENKINLRFETGTLEYDLNKINLKKQTENLVTTVYEYKKTNLTPKGDKKDIIDNNNNNNNNNNQEFNFEDVFFQKGGKQNAALNGLPLFEDVYNINNLEFNLEEEENNDIINKNVEIKEEINRENFISYEMGTTANIMLIKNGYIYIANVGDSLSVMYKNGKAYNLNKEHQIIIESEKERVLKSGATIVGYRINGMLNLTRALGDLKFKSNPNLKLYEQSVIAVPEITKVKLTNDIDFIIMGCDGVWDCVKRQLVCEFVEKQIKENPNQKLSEILKVIFQRCVSPVWGVVVGTDNMSCIIIQFLKDKNNIKNNIIAKKINFGKQAVENIEIEVK